MTTVMTDNDCRNCSQNKEKLSQLLLWHTEGADTIFTAHIVTRLANCFPSRPIPLGLTGFEDKRDGLYFLRPN